MKKRIVLSILLIAVFTGFVFANPDQELLKKVDDLVSYYNKDFSAEYTFLQEVPGQGITKTVAGVFRRDSQEQYVIIVMEPAESKGQGYLKQGSTLWFYDPESRRFNTTKNTERFQNTNASNSDFTQSTLAKDYKVIAGENTRLGRFNCRLLTLEAVTKEVTYPKMKVWVSEDGLLRKSEDYSLSGQLLRTTAIADYYFISGSYIPKQMLIVDELKGGLVNGVYRNERTQITISKPSFENIPNYVFSTTFLENVQQ